jgi:septum formation protein
MLESAGSRFDGHPSESTKSAIRVRHGRGGRVTPRDVVDALAEFKARKGQDKNPDALVLGSDQVLALKGRVFGKPEDRRPQPANFLSCRDKPISCCQAP